MMHEKSMLDEFYLESIKNKIKLLNEWMILTIM